MNKLLESLLILGAQYGLPFVIDCIKSLKKTDITINDIEVLFSNVKPYEAYQIPDIVPGNASNIFNPIPPK